MKKDDILAQILKISKTLGRVPTRREFIRDSEFTVHDLAKHFGGWKNVLGQSGLSPRTTGERIEDTILLEDWGRVAREIGVIPTTTHYVNLGNHARKSFRKHFGLWSEVPQAFARFAKERPEWQDIVALIDYDDTTTLQRRRQSPAKQTKSGEGASKRHPRLTGRTIYGDPLDFRGLRHEPSDEAGVVFLFGMVARELGFLVERVQTQFPDCEAKRRIGAGRWQTVHIEFEFESKNFPDHGHDPSGCDMIVCWRNNWSNCPENIEIIELSEEIKKLPKSGD